MPKVKKQTVVLGLTGSIAAYKIPFLARDLKKLGFDVFSVLTENAKKFVTPWTLEALTGHPSFGDMFYLKGESPYPHIELSKKADILVIAPATANFIAKAAWGIADDLLSTLFLSCCCPKLLVPAMNEKMYLSRQTQDNIKALKGKGVCVMAAEKGEMACGDEGCGRMSDPKKIIRKIKILMRSHG